ncbi:MAG TPA: methyltransferase domain-containing protein [Elusimicrobiales bacterium]|nr:methyltransferase domain-containing protein [Elusimicrobiales bacterium]
MSEVWDKKDYVDRYNDIYAPAEKELMAAADLLELNSDDDLADFGCGKGDFIASTLRLVRSAVGVDSSPHQIDEARRRFKNEPHVEILESSFQDFDPRGRTFTKAYSRDALHHINDAEKEIFLKKVSAAMEPGGLFLIEDAIFEFPAADLEANWDALLAEAEKHYGEAWPARKDEVTGYFRNEFPTGLPEMGKMAEAAGFKVLKTSRDCMFFHSLLLENK